MRPEEIVGPERGEWLSRPPDELRAALEELHPEDLAGALTSIEEIDDVAKFFRALSVEVSASVMERLPAERQQALLDALNKDEGVEVIAEMAPDDRADLVQEMDEKSREVLLEHLREAAPEVAHEVHELAAYGEDTAGGIMTTEFVGLSPETQVNDAVAEVRRASKKQETEHIYYVYVLYGEQLVGVCSLRQLLLAEPHLQLEQIMATNVVRVLPGDDQEQVADLIAKYDLSAVPVVDDQSRMLGVVTIDDVVDVVIQEATEDAQRMGGVAPLENSYFQTSFVTFIRKRAGWLTVLFLGEMLTTSVMEKHNVAAIAGLGVFVPLIIATGGNSGSQSSSLIIRALAVGEMAPQDWLRVLARELGIGLVLGLLLGLIGSARAGFLGNDGSIHLAITVGWSIMAVVTLGTLLGSLLPLGIRRLGLDPAVSSTPFIASLVDVVGLLVYFTIAAFIFGVAI